MKTSLEKPAGRIFDNLWNSGAALKDSAEGGIDSFVEGVSNTIGGQEDQVQPDPERGNKLIKQMASGGLMLGGGVGAAVVLANYLKSLREESALEDESRLNDDTLYIKSSRGQEKKAVGDWAAPALGATSMVVGGIGSYALTQKIYSYMMKKRRQEMLDEAQNEALTLSDEEIAKSAGDESVKMTTADSLLSTLSLPLLTALASGGLSYYALNKAFPVIKSPKSRNPKRIRQVADDGSLTDVSDEYLPEEYRDDLPEELGKDASSRREFDDCSSEFLVLITSQLAHEKGASVSITSDLLHTASSEGIGEISNVYDEGGLESLIEVVKGASNHEVTLADKVVGAALLCKSARLNPIVSMLAAAEYQDMVPGLCSVVSAQSPESIEKLATIGTLIHASMFRPEMEKASAVGPAMGQLQGLLSRRHPQGMVDSGRLPNDIIGGSHMPDEMTEVLQSDAGGVMAEETEDDGRENDPFDEGTRSADDEINKGVEKDPVDEFMAFGDDISEVSAAGDVADPTVIQP